MSTATYETSLLLQQAGIEIKTKERHFREPAINFDEGIPAPTFEELWAVLPAIITGESYTEHWHQSFDKVLMSGFIGYVEFGMFGSESENPNYNIFHKETDTNLAEAAALLLLWCHKEGYMRPKCQSCGKEDSQPPHICPYKEDVNRDSKTKCDCCDECQYHCRMDA